MSSFGEGPATISSGDVTVSGNVTVSSGTVNATITNPVDGYDNVEVAINNNLKIGAATSEDIENTENRLDLTVLLGADGYPMDIELEARDVACYVRQGNSTVALDPTVNGRIQSDQWRRINVANVNEAYIAVQNTSSGETGTLVAMRLDSV